MASSNVIKVKRGGTPDEQRPFKGHGHVEVHHLGSGPAMRAVFLPGWKWSVDVAPIAGTKSCQTRHLGFVISGRMLVRADDGTESELRPGDFIEIEPGHDAWVVGDEPCVMVDFGGIEQYAKSAKQARPERPSAPSHP